jgi:hypothetical protein
MQEGSREGKRAMAEVSGATVALFSAGKGSRNLQAPGVHEALLLPVEQPRQARLSVRRVVLGGLGDVHPYLFATVWQLNLIRSNYVLWVRVTYGALV